MERSKRTNQAPHCCSSCVLRVMSGSGGSRAGGSEHRAAARRPTAAFTAPCVAVGYSARPGPAVASHLRVMAVSRGQARLSDLSGFWSATVSDQVAVASGDPRGSGLLAHVEGPVAGAVIHPTPGEHVLGICAPAPCSPCRPRSFQGSPGRSRGTPALLGAGGCCWAGSLTPSPLRKPVFASSESRGGNGERERGRG